MKRISYIKIGVIVGLFSLLGLSAQAQTRMQRVAWTDRTLTNPPLTEQASINGSIERFWNLPVDQKEGKSRSLTRPAHRKGVALSTSNGVAMEQKRVVRERRGFFGINLFNLIPLIDIVHGDVVTESSDNVSGKR
jgi:hypothetical protein